MVVMGFIDLFFLIGIVGRIDVCICCNSKFWIGMGLCEIFSCVYIKLVDLIEEIIIVESG